MQLEDGVGRPGDQYEQHADAVAGLVVAGRSAEALLEAHCGTGPVAAGIQAQAVQCAILELADSSYDIRTGAVLVGEEEEDGVIAAHRGGPQIDENDLAIRLSEAFNWPQGALTAAEPVSGDLGFVVVVEDQQERQGMLDAVRGWRSIESRVNPEHSEALLFAGDFRSEFANILYAFDEELSDTTGQALYDLFTDTQRQMLTALFNGDRTIPEALFNGTEVGNADAQQRVLMSAHLLAEGQAPEGGRETDEGHLRAGSCGHWGSDLRSGSPPRWWSGAPAQAGGPLRPGTRDISGHPCEPGH